MSPTENPAAAIRREKQIKGDSNDVSSLTLPPLCFSLNSRPTHKDPSATLIYNQAMTMQLLVLVVLLSILLTAIVGEPEVRDVPA